MRNLIFAVLGAVAFPAAAAPVPAQIPDTVAADSIPDAPAPARSTRNTGSFTITSGGGYNRVEGLPVLVGPVVETAFGSARLRTSALGIIRSAGTFRVDGDNLGHDLTIGALFDPAERTSLTVRAYDIVDAVEDWQIPRDEAGLAAFFFRSDFRDHYGRHGASVAATYAASRRATLSASFARERWRSREIRDVLTVFRNGKAWRPNPVMDEGLFHVATAGLAYDNRNDPRRPTTGWLIRAEYELGSGRIDASGATSLVARGGAVNSEPRYGRVFVDARRYFRLSPTNHLSGRVVAGGWVHGDELPLQRRLSVSGVGAVPGIDFREPSLGPDVGQCSTSPAPAGDPAQCERALLAQVEYRVSLRSRPGSIIGRTVRIRSRAFTLSPSLVLFADAGRGWLVEPGGGEPDAPLPPGPAPVPVRDLLYSAWTIPPLGTFRTDIGAGVDLGLFGIYVAKSLSESGEPMNVFLRARRRF
jgi:surface antigen Omp85-like protein